MTEIAQVAAPKEKRRIAREILEALPEWFGIAQAREDYIADSAQQVFFRAAQAGRTVGFLCLRQTGDATAELAVMGVLKAFHRQGVGRALAEAAKAYAARAGYAFLQVKTVQMGRYPIYDATNRFYLALGFREFEVFPTLWDAHNPCQIYVMSLRP